MKITRWPDHETPMSIEDDILRVDWYDCYEGLCGDYNPEDPNDVHLLRFDVYQKYDDEWMPVEDASYCTQMPYETEPDILERALKSIFKEYKAGIIAGVSVKKLGEHLSWISPDDFD